MLKRKVTASIRFVFAEDDALSCTEDEYNAYLEGGCDWTKLKFKEGAKPTVFTLQQLTHRQKLARDTFSDGFGKSCFTVRCILLKLENYAIELPSGELEHFEDLERKREGELGELVTEAQLAKLHLSMNELGALSLAGMAISEANLPLLRLCGFRAGELASSMMESTAE